MNKVMSLVFVCLGLTLFGNHAYATVAAEKQLKVEVQQNLLHIQAKNVNAHEIVEAVAQKTAFKVKIYNGVPDRKVTLEVSAIPIHDIEAILKKLGYKNVAIVYDKKAKAIAAFILPVGADSGAVIRKNPCAHTDCPC
ncbi:hypothetical protein QUF90_21860 [Desulfococcaceae bacterium HSG9]|nr:hypothetical protein [Desulfococcaceae bacterium HSG9]